MRGTDINKYGKREKNAKVKEGDSRLWESKVNTPLDTAIKNNQKDYIDKRKL